MTPLDRRRELLLMQESGLDTTPEFVAYGYRWDRGQLVENSACNATKIYSFPPSQSARKIESDYCVMQICIYRDGTYIDYWSISNTRAVINANSNGLAISVSSNYVDDAYLYIQETGEIIFAGKNTIYYGHKNISELN